MHSHELKLFKNRLYLCKHDIKQVFFPNNATLIPYVNKRQVAKYTTENVQILHISLSFTHICWLWPMKCTTLAVTISRESIK